MSIRVHLIDQSNKKYRRNILFIFPVLFILTGCGHTGEVKESVKEVVQEVKEKPSVPSASDDYVKPEGWVTVTNKQYGFSVDVPPEIKDHSLDVGKSSNLAASNGMTIGSKDTNYGLNFSIYPQIKKLNKIDNPDLIKKGGDALRYFKYIVYFDDVENFGDDLFLPRNDVPEQVTRGGYPFITFNIRDEALAKENGTIDELFTTAKTIVRSFKKL